MSRCIRRPFTQGLITTSAVRTCTLGWLEDVYRIAESHVHRIPFPMNSSRLSVFLVVRQGTSFLVGLP